MISIEKLSLTYGGYKALSDIDLKIQKGEVLALIGPSGCGKSSLLRCLNRMCDTIPAAKMEGKILLQDEDILAKNYDVVTLRRKIGMVFQKPNPFPKSVRDNLLFAPNLQRKLSKAEADELVQETLIAAGLWLEIKDRLEILATDLSGGQQQRLCIARALAVAPEILLMDEPCSALDPASTEKIEQRIKEWRGRYTILIVTHNLAQARRVSDRVAFMHQGRLIEQGPTAELFAKPQDERTHGFINGLYG